MGDSGVTVIMAASQAVDPGSTPGCRTWIKIFFASKAVVAFHLSFLLARLESYL